MLEFVSLYIYRTGEIMRAILMKEPGTPDVLEFGETEKPTCGASEILVQVVAAGINPVDTKIRSNGLFIANELPAILGCDGAGIVEAVGADVTRFEPGDPVYYC